MSEFITLNNVSKEYSIGDSVVKAVDGVSIDITKGEFVIIIGDSGAGKSTVLNMLGGIDRCTTGEIIVNASNISTMSERKLSRYRRTDVGFVFQFYNLIPNLTAYENVELAAKTVSNPANIDEVISAVGLTDRAQNFPSQLSGGEQQRIAIARAIVKRPSVLLCDEPTGALDYGTGKNVLSLIHDICKNNNVTVVLITHNSAITAMADRIITMRNGQVVNDVYNQNIIPIEEIEW